MVYDCFTFYNELDLLEIRMDTLDALVDKFVIVEATQTHRGVPKKLNFKENEARYSRFKNKIIYIAVDDFPRPEEHYINAIGDDWTLENWQRHCIVRGLVNCLPDDIIMVSDLDEIPKPKVLSKIFRTISEEIVALEMDHYDFYLNFLTNQPPGPAIRVLRYKTLQNRVKTLPILQERAASILPTYQHSSNTNKLRSSHFDRIVRNAAWHFSYIGNLDTILAKARSIVENSSTHKIDESLTQTRIYNGRDIYFRGYVMRPIISTWSLPSICRESRFSHLFYRAPLHHKTILFLQFSCFQAGVKFKHLLNSLNLPSSFIHKIRRLLPD